MRLAVACAAAAVVASTAFTAGAAVSARPTLLIVETRPAVTVAGTRFHARERVRLTLLTDSATRTRWVRASRRGSFYASVGPVPEPFDPCRDVFRVLARGALGDHAVVRYLPRGCPPPP